MKKILVCVLIVPIIALTGCSGMQELDPAMHAKVLVYPSIDLRENKESLDFKKFAKNKILFEDRVSMAENILRTRYYYIPSYLSDPPSANITYAQLQNPDPQSLKSIESQGTRYVLVIVIKEFHSDFKGIQSIKARLEGYLIDKQQGQIIWKNYASDSGWGGVLNPLIDWYSVTSPPTQVMQKTMTKLMDKMPILKPDNSTSKIGG